MQRTLTGCLVTILLLTSSLYAQCPVPAFEIATDDPATVHAFASIVDPGSLTGVDSVTLYVRPKDSQEESGWDFLETGFRPLTASIKLDPLRGNTKYEVRGQSLCGTETSDLSEAISFTTTVQETPAGDRRIQAPTLATAGFNACETVTGSTWGATPTVEGDSCVTEGVDDVWYRFKFSGDFTEVTFRKTGGNAERLRINVIDRMRRDTACGYRTTYASFYDGTLLFDKMADSLWFQIVPEGEDTYADFEICATTLDYRIAEGDGCTQAPTVNFDGTGMPREFINIETESGRVVGIENTQPLGDVTVSFFDYDGPPRESEDGGAVYLNRNISIVPENQPEDTVLVRLYLSAQDLEAVLDTGVISDEGLLAVHKVPATVCSAAFPGGGEAVEFRGAGMFGLGGYIDVVVTSFSEFFIYPADQAMVSSVTDNAEAVLPWGASPNPLGDVLTLHAPPALANEAAEVSVYTVGGRAVRKVILPAGLQRTLSTAEWPAGIYLLTIATKDQISSLRLVK